MSRQVSRRVQYVGVVSLVAAVVGAVVDACAKQPSASNHESLVTVCDTVPELRAGVHARVPSVNTPTTTGTLAGSVDERLTDLAVGGASVRIRGAANRDVNSDSTGGFVAEDLNPGLYSVSVIHIGYDPARDSVQVTAGSVVTRHYHLKYWACP